MRHFAWTRILFAFLCLFAETSGVTQANDAFVQPHPDAADALPVWGHREGLRIGLAPTPGPAGLIRIYAPYLNQPFPRVVNFVSIEPSVKGLSGRGQSELEMSQNRPGERGLSFWASDEERSNQPPSRLAAGVIDETGDTLRLFIHTERFRNGAHPVIECRFHKSHPFEVEFATHVVDDSDAIESCVLSATMGNYGLLRQIHLHHGRVVTATQLWQDEPLDRLGFLPWRHWPAAELSRSGDGRYLIELSTDMSDPSRAEHDPNVAAHWRYVGTKAVHYWRTESDAQPLAAVNGRRTYWMSQARIPGGVAFENFELRVPFQPGRRLWFGVRHDVTGHDGVK